MIIRALCYSKSPFFTHQKTISSKSFFLFHPLPSDGSSDCLNRPPYPLYNSFPQIPQFSSPPQQISKWFNSPSFQSPLFFPCDAFPSFLSTFPHFILFPLSFIFRSSNKTTHEKVDCHLLELFRMCLSSKKTSTTSFLDLVLSLVPSLTDSRCIPS